MPKAARTRPARDRAHPYDRAHDRAHGRAPAPYADAAARDAALAAELDRPFVGFADAPATQAARVLAALRAAAAGDRALAQHAYALEGALARAHRGADLATLVDHLRYVAAVGPRVRAHLRAAVAAVERGCPDFPGMAHAVWRFNQSVAAYDDPAQ